MGLFSVLSLPFAMPLPPNSVLSEVNISSYVPVIGTPMRYSCKHEKSTKSLAEVATEARESSLVLSQDEGNHDDSGNDIGNSRPIDHEYPISH